jgi:hypothetical protein
MHYNGVNVNWISMILGLKVGSALRRGHFQLLGSVCGIPSIIESYISLERAQNGLSCDIKFIWVLLRLSHICMPQLLTFRAARESHRRVKYCQNFNYFSAINVIDESDCNVINN